MDNRHTAWYSQVSCAAVEFRKLKHRFGQTHKLCVKTQLGTSCSAGQCSVARSAGRNQGVTAIYHIHPPMNTLCSLNVVPRFCQISCLHFANSHSHPTNICSVQSADRRAILLQCLRSSPFEDRLAAGAKRTLERKEIVFLCLSLHLCVCTCICVFLLVCVYFCL